MSVVSMERRLRKLEYARSPSKGTLFLLWGHDPADLSRRAAAACEMGLIEAGDLIVRAVWPLPDLPPSRWVTSGGPARDGSTTPFDRAELAALADYAMSQVAADVAPTGEPDPEAARIVERWPHPDVRPPTLNVETDAHLVASLLGERYLRGAHPVDERQRGLAALEVESRASIRNGFDALDRLRAEYEEADAHVS